LKIVSLGSGAAVPNIQATEVIEHSGKRVDWTFYDLDPEALEKAQEMIGSSGVVRSSFDYGPENGEKEKKETGNRYKGRSYLAAREVDDGSLDAVDALGLWEYLSENQAVTFLKTLYPKLKPGAPMIVSNMLKSRPHPNYNKRAVGWPDLNMRTTEDMLEIVERAMIPTSNVRLTFAEDGVYVVMEIKRPKDHDDS
jgi:hypothetical protein